MAATLKQKYIDEEHVELDKFIVPNLTVKDLLSVIPAHCFERSAIKSGAYVLVDLAIISGLVLAFNFGEPFISPSYIPQLASYEQYGVFKALKFLYWAYYGFCVGLPATGLWVIAHECGHQAFSTSKFINNSVGWVLHSALGVPYHSWRISHAKHHAHTGHLTEDQVFVPKTRTTHPYNLPKFDENKDDVNGGHVSKSSQNEMFEAVGDSPLSAMAFAALQLTLGWPLYLILNSSGQKWYPKGTNHFNPFARALFKPQEWYQILVSDIGVAFWLAAMGTWVHSKGWMHMLGYYFVPYLWVNHWLVMITFLQHTDPYLPHYRAGAFTFPRGALTTLDRNLMGGPGIFGAITGWIGAFCLHGIAETHVTHHVASKIPHYNAWEANAALHERIKKEGLELTGRPATWAEVVRVYRACKFVEDEGDVVFYKNAQGFASRVAIFKDEPHAAANDSGVEVDEEDSKTK